MHAHLHYRHDTHHEPQPARNGQVHHEAVGKQSVEIL